ncbi:MAG: DJ-1/PfpI family protein [Bacillota bacterium]|nr:DJ-1/PfpI family protein [Bacillota bacterium]MDW7683635.1 DJ-1/PfpI family protein [Bacillota bacterium]
MQQTAIMIIIFPDVEELDFVGPYEALSYLNKVGRNVSVFTVSEDGKELACANGLHVVPHYSFETAPRADWVIVPGGNGRKREMQNPVMLDFVKRAAKEAQIVASVCTGAFILAAAGILTRGRATTYHMALDELRAFAPDLDVTGARMEKQGNIYTAAGVSAGIDLALDLCDHLEPGLGKLVAEKIEYRQI